MHVNISVTVKVVGGFLFVMAKLEQIKRNYLHFHRFLCVIIETRSLLTDISLVVNQSLVNISLALCARDIFTSQLTSTRDILGNESPSEKAKFAFM